MPTVGAGDEVREVFDIPFVPNQTNQGCVAPWLVSTGFPAAIAGFPGTFIGDGVARTTTTGATVSITGPVSATTDQFTIFGKVWDGTLNTPAATDRASYDRPALGGQAGQVDTFATSTAVGATITVTGGPNLPHGAQSLVGPDGVGRFGSTKSEHPLYGLLPEDHRAPYDMRAILDTFLDAGKFEEFQADFAKR